ncbi:hypothetical protein HT576_10800 [Haloterrigena sp. SYSU A121-1]|uniref:Uncharacterized protein n=2 Tax=Haloterrigena gelatinilytica TaxID=2741724 RepID=A0A8J8GPB1_9EURY|nr:hypothetical protein [Haloterrigena gelatinilytica]
MSNEDSRGNESSDRRDASPRTTDHTDYRPILEILHTHTTNLLNAVNDDPELDPPTRKTARRHCRELRAELECVHRELPDPPETVCPPIDDAEAVTIVSDPAEAALEAARRQSRSADPDDAGGADDD